MAKVHYNLAIIAIGSYGMLRRLIVALAVTFLVQVLVAQAPGQAPANSAKTQKPPGNCTVRGRVVGAADGAPLRSARVGLIQANERRHPLVYATTTDNEGHFEIKQIESGRYNFYASHIGYLEQQYQSKGSGDDDGAVLSLVSGQEVNDAMFRLVRAGVITGRVVDDTGEPMMNVNVSVLHKPSDEEREQEGPRGKKLEMTSVSTVVSDDRGEYRIYGLKPGEYFVKAVETGEGAMFFGQMQEGSDEIVLRELGSQYAPVFYPGVLQMDQAQAVTLSAGEETQADLPMRRMRMVEVAGRVIGPDGAPAVRAYVRLSQPGVEDWGGELGGGADNKGEFSIKGVAPGSYYVSAGMRDKEKFYSTRQKIDVGEARIEGMVLSLGGGATIHGRVRTASGAPPPAGRIMIRLQPAAEEGEFISPYVEVSKESSFEINAVADGGYALTVYGLEQGWFVKSAHLGNEDVLQNGVQVEGGAAKGSLDIVVSADGAQIEGTVTDSDKSQPLAGVQVKARVDPPSDYNFSRFRATTSDQNGHYVLKDVPPGKYKVTAKIASTGPGSTPVKSDPVAMSVGEREHRGLDIKLKVPESQ
jgi:protocatechuate 3,4-dioxygenase beta subunit